MFGLNTGRRLPATEGVAPPAPSRRFRDARLERDGYFAVQNLISAEEAQRIRAILLKLLEQRAGFEQGAFLDLVGAESTGTHRLPQILRPSDYSRELHESEFFKRATELARSLLGPSARFASDHTILKPARVGPETPWHQDEAFRDPGMDWHEISIWLALQPVDVSNGCMQFVPGSHRVGILPHRPLGNDSRVHALECYTGFDRADAVPCPLPVGGCTVHTARTLHYAGPNLSDQDRVCYVLIFDLPPVPSATMHEAPWLAERRTARDAREAAWRRGRGKITYYLQRLRRINYSRPDHLFYVVRTAGKMLRRKLSRAIRSDA